MIGLARVLLSILVVYAFLAALITASAQPSIAAGPKDVTNPARELLFQPLGKPGDDEEGEKLMDSPEKRARS